MPKKKILHVFTTLPVGGAEHVLLSTLGNLNKDKYESLVCCIQDKGVLGEQVIKMGFPLIELHLMHKKGWDGQVVRELSRIIREEHVDLVHSHLYHANLYSRIAAWRSGVPAVITVHNTYLKRKWYRQLLNRLLAKVTGAIVAVSEDIRADVLRYDKVPEKLVHVIPNGIDLTRVASTLSSVQARQRLGLSADDFVLGTVGRLEEQKGQRYLIQAVGDLKASGIGVKLLIIGDGRLREELEKQIQQLNVQDSVSLLGTRKDVADILKAVDLFVMPSLWEGLSLAMLEAMAAGIPVVATDVGGVSQVFGDNEYGYRIQPGSAQALADKIAYCLASKENVARMAKKGQQLVREKYSSQNMVRNLEKIYRAVLSK